MNDVVDWLKDRKCREPKCNNEREIGWNYCIKHQIDGGAKK